MSHQNDVSYQNMLYATSYLYMFESENVSTLCKSTWISVDKMMVTWHKYCYLPLSVRRITWVFYCFHNWLNIEYVHFFIIDSIINQLVISYIETVFCEVIVNKLYNGVIIHVNFYHYQLSMSTQLIKYWVRTLRHASSRIYVSIN
jgi:hypothetical protein